MGSCTPNCLQTCKPFRTVIPGEVVSPFVNITFTSQGNQSITVGNQSSPNFNNQAAIKSFEFGVSDGLEVNIEIVDEEGGAFKLFTDNMLKCVPKATEQIGAMFFTFGWIVANKDGSFSQISSQPCHATIPQIEISYDNGKIYFKLKGADTLNATLLQQRVDIFGTKNNPVDVKNAMQKLFQESKPEIQVEFKDAKGNTIDIVSVTGTNTNGIYDCGNQNPLAVANRWKSLCVSKNGNGFVPVWSAAGGESKITFVENSTNEDCNLSVDCGGSSIGTFIVNGGNCSNVISFTPSFDFTGPIYNVGVGGGTSGGSSAKTVQHKNLCNGQTNTTGVAQSLSASRLSHSIYGKETQNIDIANSRNFLADASFIPSIKAITADLKVQGMPQFAAPVLLLKKFCSIIAINPFYIAGYGCGNWLAQPGCNAILSNKNWQIIGASHSIQDGSFTTTFKVTLGAPAAELASDQPFGGQGGTYFPANADCGKS